MIACSARHSQKSAAILPREMIHVPASPVMFRPAARASTPAPAIPADGFLSLLGQSPLRAHPLAWRDLSPFLATHPRDRRKSTQNALVTPLLATHTKVPPVTPFPATHPEKGGEGHPPGHRTLTQIRPARPARLGLAEMLWSYFPGQEKAERSQAACILARAERRSMKKCKINISYLTDSRIAC